ncbi:MAG: hypothetical protein Kilf2KO_47740 [Rhodospirillales bacterium]
MCISRPSPTPVAPPPPPKTQPALPAQSRAAQSARDRERRQRRAAFGPAATLLTGGQGLTRPASRTTKQLLGE